MSAQNSGLFHFSGGIGMLDMNSIQLMTAAGDKAQVSLSGGAFLTFLKKLEHMNIDQRASRALDEFPLSDYDRLVVEYKKYMEG